jgi:GNAT superfamily N-acetyltransferase
MDVDVLTDPLEVLERAEPLLLADEARHNLAFGILSSARDHPDVYPELRGWVVSERSKVVAAALLTPPHNLVLARPLLDGALDELAGSIDEELPGVVGAVPEVDRFAQLWADRRGVGVETRFEQRIYALRRVAAPSRGEGAMRLAGTADRDLVLAWAVAFSREALHDDDADTGRLERSVDARLDASETSGIALWEADGGPVALAGFGGPTPNGIRIGPVYTPPEHRGRGYGSAVTAATSQLQLDRGRRLCFLYTDLANPTSNAIYVRIGYEPVCDSRELAFEPQPVPPAEYGPG